MNYMPEPSPGYYRFGALHDSAVCQAVFTRRGGVSQAPYDSLNIGSYVGDDPQCVEANLGLMYWAIGVQTGQIVSARQVHGCRIVRVRAREGGSVIPDCDGLISNTAGLILLMRFADCVPVLVWDPVHKAVGLAHAGWRGTLQHVASGLVEQMAHAFGSRPADLRAAIGPSIGPCCFQVGPEAVAAVRAQLEDSDQVLDKFTADGHAYLDLSSANQHQLKGSGVRNVEAAACCTACHPELFYSHRASAGQTGRFGVAIGLR